MIRNNRLSYASVGLPWYFLDISQTSLSSFVTSVLITLISYQAASILFNISFGKRKRHETKVKNLAILLLTRYLSSPLSILNSIFRADWLTRLYYRGEIPKDTHISRDPARVKLRTIAVLLLLVFTAPIIDTVLVTFTLSRTRELTFEEAGFRGVLFGVEGESGSVETIPFISLCDRALYEERSGDVLKSFFQLCATPNLPEEESDDVTGVELVLIREHQVGIRVIVQGLVMTGAKWAQLTSDDGEKFIQAQMSNSSVLRLVDTALDGFELRCGERNRIGEVPAKETNVFNTENRLLASVRVSCEGIPIPEQDKVTYATEIIESLKAKLTFVESDTTLVQNATDVGGSFMAQRNALLLLRTQTNTSLIVLIIVFVGLLAIRVAFGLFLANHVEEGLESSVRERLGLGKGIFGVWNDEYRVQFRKKYQNGEWCHMGMEREEISEVENLRGGTIGDLNEGR